MALKQQCFFIYGSDTYQAKQAMKAIQNRFLAKQDSMADFCAYDLEDTNLDVLKQTLLAVPFFVTHRLFVLKFPFSAPKATQEALPKLMEQIAPSTVVVFYEPGAPDQRLSLYKWLIAHATVQAFPKPEGIKLQDTYQAMAKKVGVSFQPQALSLFTRLTQDTEQASHEIAKLSAYALSQGSDAITTEHVTTLGSGIEEESVFVLTNLLRDGKTREAVKLFQTLSRTQEPLFLGGLITGHVRTLTKIWMAHQQGIMNQGEIAKKTGLNPYVVKLQASGATNLTKESLANSYSTLCWFDEGVKDGTLPPVLGVLLLILKLHGTLNKTPAQR